MPPLESSDWAGFGGRLGVADRLGAARPTYRGDIGRGACRAALTFPATIHPRRVMVPQHTVPDKRGTMNGKSELNLQPTHPTPVSPAQNPGIVEGTFSSPEEPVDPDEVRERTRFDWESPATATEQ